MQIVSTLLAPEDGVLFMVFDTLLGAKSLVTTMVVGDARLNTVSPVGQRCIDRLARHCDANHPQGAVHIVELRVRRNIADKVRKALRAASDGDALIFYCFDSVIYDDVFPLLGFKPPAGGFVAH